MIVNVVPVDRHPSTNMKKGSRHDSVLMWTLLKLKKRGCNYTDNEINFPIITIQLWRVSKGRPLRINGFPNSSILLGSECFTAVFFHLGHAFSRNIMNVVQKNFQLHVTTSACKFLWVVITAEQTQQNGTSEMKIPVALGCIVLTDYLTNTWSRTKLLPCSAWVLDHYSACTCA